MDGSVMSIWDWECRHEDTGILLVSVRDSPRYHCDRTYGRIPVRIRLPDTPGTCEVPLLPNIWFPKCGAASVTDIEGKFHLPRRRRWAAACLLLLCTSASAAVMSLPDQVGAASQTVAAAISFAAEGQAISGLQFDLEWDSPLDVLITGGTRTRASTKLLYTASTGPRGTRCLFIGYDRDTLGDGELLNVFVVIASDAPTGTAMVRFTNAVATSPDGTPVELRSQAASVRVQSGSAPQPL